MSSYTQARVRVNKDGALELDEGMIRLEHFLLDIRDAIKDPDERKALNRRISVVRRVQREVERVIEEQGWLPEAKHDEPQPAHP